MVIFLQPRYEYLKKAFVNIPAKDFGSYETRRFANGEIHISLNTKVNKKPCVIVVSINPPDENLLALLLLAHTLKKEGAQKVAAILPYMAYSRHDKDEVAKSQAFSWLGKVFKSSGINKVITIDIHSQESKGLFGVPVISVASSPIFASEIKALKLSNATIVAPDEGAIKRCRLVAKEANISRIAYFKKHRTASGVVHSKLYGKVTNQAIIVDDMLDTGSTLVSACYKLREAGVVEIYIMVTHGLFTGDEWKHLWKLGAKRVYCTDTIPLPKQVATKNIKVLSIMPILTDALLNKEKGVISWLS
ncbi:MAG: ribose-phosphate diphosphokinase [Candidatus Curtissbacteria bacterium]|nr:ribose-phosphate diphosphokinase [Candidatus Curtissbacteria bacterium]